MSAELGMIEKALGAKPNEEIIDITNELEKKKALRQFWSSDSGKNVINSLTEDCFACLTSLQNFEKLDNEEIRGFLAKYRANVIVLSTMQGIRDIDQIQGMLDKAVKEMSEELAR